MSSRPALLVSSLSLLSAAAGAQGAAAAGDAAILVSACNEFGAVLHRELACDVLLPAEGKALDDPERVLLRGGYAGQLAPAQVSVQLPKFTVAAAHRLKEALRALGVRKAFTAAADLSGVTKADRLLVDEVVYQTWIRVDEQGAEAAAATAVLLRRGGRPGELKEFRADRPFAFALRDVRTGLLLFVGRVDDPRAGS